MGFHALLQGIFLTQESNPSLLHCRQILYHLSYHISTNTFVIPKHISDREPLAQRIKSQMLRLAFKIFFSLTPSYLSGLNSQLSLLFCFVFFFFFFPFVSFFFQLSFLNQSGVWVLKQNPTLMNPKIKGTQR